MATAQRSRHSVWLTPREGFCLLGTLLVLIGAPAATIVVSARELEVTGRGFHPEVLLPVILLVGVISLLAVLLTVVGLYRRFGLTNPAGALGLPDGSIQAVIALGLILIFAILGVYLHGVAGQPQLRLSTGLTRAQVDALPPDSIVRINTRADRRFDVDRAVENRQQAEFANQLLTTVSTLVVAVAGFYFGSKSVKEASVARRRRREDDEAGQTASREPDDGEPVTESGASGKREQEGATAPAKSPTRPPLAGEAADAPT